MKNKYGFVFVLLLMILVVGWGSTKWYLSTQNKETEQSSLTVVTSFYPMYIAAQNLLDGCDNVTLENLSEPQTGCLHDYQLTPADMKLLSTADVFIVNGGGIESFLTQVAKAYPDLTIVNASEGLSLLEDNAHVWMSPTLYSQQVEKISQGLADSDSENRARIQDNTKAYQKQISSLINEIQQLREVAKGQNVIIFHEAYEYLAEDLGMNVTYCMDLDEERQVSAGEVADVIAQIQDNHVKLVLAEELYGKSMGDTVQQQTDVNILYLNTLVRGDYKMDSYITGMEENLEILKEALE